MFDDILGNKDIEIKLNFKLGERTPNKRLYNKNMLLNEIDDKLNNKNLFVTRNFFHPPLNKNKKYLGIIALNDIIGKAKSYKIKKNNTIIFKVEIYDKSIIDDDKILTIDGIGEVDENYNIKNYKLISLVLIDI